MPKEKRNYFKVISSGILNRMRGFLDSNLRDIFLLVGFLLIGYGLWCIYHPLAFVICGAMLLWTGLPPKEKPPQERRHE